MSLYFDNDGQLDEFNKRVIGGIINELLRPQNRDLLIAVQQHGLDGETSFEGDFSQSEPLEYWEWVDFTQQLDGLMPQLVQMTGDVYEPDFRDMSERYAAYIEEHEQHTKGLNKSQSDRFEAIIAAFDDGWTGAMYGMIMRQVQALLRAELN